MTYNDSSRVNCRKAATALLCAVALAGCGGGGPDSGACGFAAADCRGATTTPNPSPVGSAFSRSGTGDTSFALPGDVSLVRIQGQFTGTSSNFVVRIGNDLVVNEIIGVSAVPQAHDGTYVVNPGATVTITNSSGVTWSVSSASSQAPPSAGIFSKSGSGDQVFDLPGRAARYRVQASFPGASSNFIVRVAGSLAINSIIGTSQTPVSFDGIYVFPAGARVEVQNSSGVGWNFTESP
ncbi:MAG: hypothetical protein ABIQ87_09585 [Rubrivivax sp.]